MNTTVYIIGGPTASGKSALAMGLAEKIGVVIINADSMQIYRELPILTAQPTAEDHARVPHLLYGVMAASERCTVARWCELAKVATEQVIMEGKIPFLVGGTGMYLKTLMEGIAEIPEIVPEVKIAAREMLNKLGHEKFHELLAKRDPESASWLKVGDTQRMLRAWEVVESTGTRLSEWQKQPKKAYLPNVRFKGVALLPERQKLYAQADKRFLAMLENGALDEVQTLLKQNLDETLPAMRALGVPELSEYVQGTITLPEAITKAQTHTRNYVKRQSTWFRNQVPELKEISNADDGIKIFQA